VTHSSAARPSVVLICHEGAPINQEGLARWLASFADLRGILLLRETGLQKRRRVQRELKRLGVLRFVDVVAMRLYYKLFLAQRDKAWTARELDRLRAAYPAIPSTTRVLVSDTPNRPAAAAFLRELAPDLVVARCKQIIKEEVFTIPRHGTLVFHPGVCPEYRNAHGCFWALARRDLHRVGMTLLRVDPGVDTGPIFLHGTYDFDEVAESHSIIQYRAVFENLDAIGAVLTSLCRGEHVEPVNTDGRESAVWGQPRLTTYLRWKWHARRSRHENRVPALS